MEKDYQHIEFDYAGPLPHNSGSEAVHPVIVVGAGPVGLTAAIDLAQQGIRTILLDDDNKLSVGSRAICFSKRTLEIFDRLHCGEPMVKKGVSWNIGKVFFRDAPVYSFNLLPEQGHRHPAFINLQQYYVEGYLYEQARQETNLDVRWKSRVVGISQSGDCAELTVETPDGRYTLRAAYVIAADGSRSAVRSLMGLESKGRTFKDRFLIADVRMKADFPTERWFWFDPPFHPNQSVLLHKQPDNVWRIDFQLGWDADPVAEKAPERVIPRVQALLGKDVEFDLEWVSIYTFSCLRMEQFRHGRVLFAGDSAHGVSPFGARGANSGVQDADNLAWKLKLVLDRKAPPALLDSYGYEREQAADENILNSTRATDFITPKSPVSKTFRDAVLLLSKNYPFARTIVNSGRLSLPTTYRGSPLSTPDADEFAGTMAPGAPSTDAPVRMQGQDGWLLSLLGNGFAGLYFADDSEIPRSDMEVMQALTDMDVPIKPIVVLPSTASATNIKGFAVVADSQGLMKKRFDARPGTYYLLRPDQHVCGRWRRLDSDMVRSALLKATCNSGVHV
ncbi:MAG TPA: FAD-dependent oxidoreductase [Noviherbaspirillum sp.]|jgi:3-(3-hydroxy-phenyl)propionate hydroxylase|uniref:FAD-dependent oxidoreductase n=1 Tax=Noviherbaspirillum sp. TaxID=1926288 RepID=UPI002DDDB756|nr:FAD-dependent oxidoreductase [Noviherbaspirillum sp.]HEV2608880.1 FAD-dependent oxidoreductase [Noviherbaspirillum sp.]